MQLERNHAGGSPLISSPVLLSHVWEPSREGEMFQRPASGGSPSCYSLSPPPPSPATPLSPPPPLPIPLASASTTTGTTDCYFYSFNYFCSAAGHHGWYYLLHFTGLVAWSHSI